jgi:hypothetical protein
LIDPLTCFPFPLTSSSFHMIISFSKLDYVMRRVLFFFDRMRR